MPNSLEEGEAIVANQLKNYWFPQLWQKHKQLPRLEKIFWWSSRDYIFEDQDFTYQPNYDWTNPLSWVSQAGMIRNNYLPKQSYLEYAKLIDRIDGIKKYNSLVLNGRVKVTIPDSQLMNKTDYRLFWVVDKKMSLGKIINLSTGEDGKTNSVDFTYISWLLANGKSSPRGDLNQDNQVNKQDILFSLINFNNNKENCY